MSTTKNMCSQKELVISGGDPPPIVPIYNKMSIGAYLCQLLKQKGNEIALIDAVTHTSYSFDKLLEKSLQLADALQKRGYCRGDIVSICSVNRLEYPVLFIAATLLGISLSTVNPQYSEGELKHIFHLTRPLAVFCSPLSAQKIKQVSSKFACIREIIIYDHVEPIIESTRIFSYKSIVDNGDWKNFYIPDGSFSEDVAVVLMSSGTTGLPKGVMLTHLNFLTQLEIARFMVPRRSSPSVIMGLIPFFHGYGLMLMLGSLVMHNRLVVLPHFNPHLFLSSIEKYKVTVLPIVPPTLVFLAKSPIVDEYNLSSIVDIRCAAAPAGKSTLDQVGKRLGLKLDSIKQGYGMTELTVRASYSYPDVPSNAVGRIVPSMKMKVLDLETGQSLGVNQVGELCFLGPLVMKGYIGNPEETENIIDSEGWLHTGDLGYYDEKHNIYIVDRLKELIKVKGFQVAPAELESLLLNHTAVQDAAVIGKPDVACGESPLAFVVRQPGATVTELDLETYVANQVSPQKRLKGGVIFVDEIPKNPGGKILRRVLRQRIQNKSKL